jgi:hypothetical protein
MSSCIYLDSISRASPSGGVCKLRLSSLLSSPHTIPQSFPSEVGKLIAMSFVFSLPLPKATICGTSEPQLFVCKSCDSPKGQTSSNMFGRSSPSFFINASFLSNFKITSRRFYGESALSFAKNEPSFGLMWRLSLYPE